MPDPDDLCGVTPEARVPAPDDLCGVTPEGFHLNNLMLRAEARRTLHEAYGSLRYKNPGGVPFG